MIFKKIEENAGVVLISSIVVGLLIPQYSILLAPYLTYLLMLILFIVFLKIDLTESLSHIKKPFLLAYILIMNLIIIPLLTYLLVIKFESDIVIGALLLAALPTGVSAAAWTGILKGKQSLALVITVLSTFIALATLPFIFYVLLKTKVSLDYIDVSLSLLQLVLVPMVIAQPIRILLKNNLNKTTTYFGGVTILLIALLNMTVIGKEAGYIFSHVYEIIKLILIIYLIFIFFQFAGYLMVFWLKKEEKITVSISKVIMNNTLGTVLAATFFSPKVTLFLVLAGRPWTTVPIIFKNYIAYLDRKQ